MTPHERVLSRDAASSLPARTASTRIARIVFVLACLAATGPASRATAGARFVPDRRQLAEIEHVLAKRYFRTIPHESLETAARLCLDGRLDPYSTWFDVAQRDAFHRMLAGEPGGPGMAPPAAPRRESRDVGPSGDGSDLPLPGEAPAGATASGSGASIDSLLAPPVATTATGHVPAIEAALPDASVQGVRADGDEAARWLADVPARIAYVRITRFTARTTGEMDAALAAVNRLGARGLVIDLRGDPGGLIRSAVAVTDRFLDAGTIVTLRRRRKTIVFHADRKVSTRVPVAVLVDARTASAAEMMASALQDHRRAIVIGQPSYGKGAVQQVIRLKRSPGYLKLTTALYRRPSGALVEEHIPGAGGAGVVPDSGFTIAPDTKRRGHGDAALERALAALQSASATALR